MISDRSFTDVGVVEQLSDIREREYRAKGIGDYMFTVDATTVVDATMKGGNARFINHSCDPNCYSRIVTVDGYKRICIFSQRQLAQGEGTARTGRTL